MLSVIISSRKKHHLTRQVDVSDWGADIGRPLVWSLLVIKEKPSAAN